MRRSAESLRNARDCILEVYTARSGAREGIRSREELISLMDRDIFITPTQAREYGLIDEIVGAGAEVADPAAFVAAAGQPHPADPGHAGGISVPRGGTAGRGGPEGTGGAHPGTAQGAGAILSPPTHPILRNRGRSPL